MTGGESIIPDALLTTISNDITATVWQIMPYAVGLFVLFFGVRLIPRLIKRFAK